MIKLNEHLSKLEREIYSSIRFMDSEKLMDLGIETLNLNFKIEVESEVFYTPIMLAAVIGYVPNL